MSHHELFTRLESPLRPTNVHRILRALRKTVVVATDVIVNNEYIARIRPFLLNDDSRVRTQAKRLRRHWKRQVHPATTTTGATDATDATDAINVVPPSGTKRTQRTQRPVSPPTAVGNDPFASGNKAVRLVLTRQWWEELSAKNGVNGWSFGFDRAKTRLGITHFATKRVALSEHFVAAPHTTDALVRNTLLHEIAHVLVGTEHGHDDVWVAKAKEIGCDGIRVSKIGAFAAHRWTWRCEKGCTVSLCHQRRNLRKTFVCRKCMTPMCYVLNQRAAQA